MRQRGARRKWTDLNDDSEEEEEEEEAAEEEQQEQQEEEDFIHSPCWSAGFSHYAVTSDVQCFWGPAARLYFVAMGCCCVNAAGYMGWSLPTNSVTLGRLGRIYWPYAPVLSCVVKATPASRFALQVQVLVLLLLVLLALVSVLRLSPPLPF
jgi:hypothetical protein